MKIVQCNPLASYLKNKRIIDAAIETTLKSGRYILGNEVKQFETKFSSYVGVPYAAAVASGTEALALALRGCGVEPGDEVITVSHTAVATVAAIEMLGAIPVLLDVDDESYTMDPDLIESAVTDKTKAIVPVHLYGHPADMDKIISVAKQHGLFVVEDCAQAHGAEYKGVKVGALGHAAAFSFYPTKNLGALGDAGIVVSKDQAIIDKIHALRQYGWKERYISQFSGVNSRMDEIQACILNIKLSFLDEDNLQRHRLAMEYSKVLGQFDLELPKISDSVRHVFHQFVLLEKSRDALKKFLEEHDCASAIHYPVPVHLQPAYVNQIKCGSKLSVTESLSGKILSLPLYPEMPHEHVDRVCELISQFKGMC